MRRSGLFYVRVAVPKDLVERVGLVEVRRSMGPRRFHEARSLASKIGARLKDAFMKIRNADDLTPTEVRNLIRDCYATLEDERGQGLKPTTNDLDMEQREQRVLAQDHATALQLQVDQREFAPETLGVARRVAAQHGVDLTDGSNLRLLQIVEGIARALIEADRLYVARIDDRLSPYVPSDPLFVESGRNITAGIGMTVQEIADEYLRVHRKSWTPKTQKTHKPKLDLLVEFLGGDRRAEDITRTDLLPYPEALLRLRRNYASRVSTTFASHQTASEEGRIQSSTAATILARATAMFRWAFKQGYISKNPAEALSIVEPKKKKGLRSRRAFNVAELETLFTTPLFTGVRSRHRRFEKGDALIRDEYFYLPILGYYTGARLGELVQLHLTDVILDTDFPHISVNEEGSEKHGENGFKHVKTEAGVRLIPLHPDLMELGFANFVARQKKFEGKGKRVFEGIKYGADGQPSTVFSKWFGRFMTKAGLDDPALVFHSFRHTAEDFLKASLAPKYLIDQIIGHEDQSASADYGVGIGLEVTFPLVANLKLPVRIPALLA
nr:MULTISPECIES: DUF6538 domain-containing protein [Sphingobium]